MRRRALGGLPRWGGYLIVPLVVWLIVTVALVGGVAWAQHRSEQQFQRRFELRATIGASFAASYVDDQLARARRQAEEFLTAPKIGEKRLLEVAGPFGYNAVVLLDRRGRLLQVVPAQPAMLGMDLGSRYEHLRLALNDGVPVVSRVVPSAVKGVPVVAFAVPFDTPQGRRVFSGALEVQNSPLGSYLAHTVALPSSRAFLLDPDGEVVASDHTITGTGRPAERPLGGAPVRAGAGEYRDSNGKNWRYVSRPVAGTPWRLVNEVPTSVLYEPGGEPGIWRAIIAAMVVLAGLVGVFGLARSRHNQQLLRESEQRFRDIFENSLIGMAIVAPSKLMLRVNPAFCAMLGYTQAQLLKRTVTDITHPDDRHGTGMAFHDALTGEVRGFSTEKRYLHADGHSVHASVTTSLLRDDAGVPLHFATQIVDITERKTFEAVREASNTQLREAHQRVEDLVAMLSHDVRQPLGVITAYTETVIEDWDTINDTRRRDFLGRVSAAARRMTILVEDILALTHLDAGTIEPRRATVDVVQALTEAIAQLPGENGALVTVNHPDQPVNAVVDPGHLQQILLNLLGNAAKYGSPPIDVSVIATDEGIEVTVADHGEGVPEEFVPQLFQRFARATTGTAVTQKGTGLGLYIVAQLAHVNHAQISYRPNRPAGSCFTVCLTAATTEPDTDTDEHVEWAGTGHGRA